MSRSYSEMGWQYIILRNPALKQFSTIITCFPGFTNFYMLITTFYQ